MSKNSKKDERERDKGPSQWWPWSTQPRSLFQELQQVPAAGVSSITGRTLGPHFAIGKKYTEDSSSRNLKYSPLKDMFFSQNYNPSKMHGSTLEVSSSVVLRTISTMVGTFEKPLAAPWARKASISRGFPSPRLEPGTTHPISWQFFLGGFPWVFETFFGMFLASVKKIVLKRVDPLQGLVTVPFWEYWTSPKIVAI